MVLNLSQFKGYIPKRTTFGLFGHPLSHTLSPKLHELLLEGTGYEADYIAVDLMENELPEGFRLAKEKLAGFNITIPYKGSIMEYLDDIEETAQEIGSVNTVRFDKASGKASGYNTDIYGFSTSLKRAGVSVEGKNAVVLGYGGTARMLCYYLVKYGANLTIAGRREQACIELRDSITIGGKKPPSSDIKISTLDGVLDNTDIIINCTPIGMYPNANDSPIQTIPKSCGFVFDCIYNPKKTRLLQLAEQAGIGYENGLPMLVLQGAKAQTIWQGVTFSDSVIDTTIDTISRGI